MCQRHGIQGDAAAAWEANGGGKFTFKLDKKGVCEAGRCCSHMYRPC